MKGFAPISLAGIAPLIMTANNNFAAKDAKELIAYAKANPGKISFGSSGIGAAAHRDREVGEGHYDCGCEARAMMRARLTEEET